MKITMCFRQLEASHIMSGIAVTKAQLSAFKLSKKLFLFMRYDILKLSTQNSRKFEFDCWVNAKIFDHIF